ncbi:hypothetical protein Amet_2685 [Alkaliphilus metalliredigens QYMF]|uniref:PASTA domain-containing protein n=1 Tax=Alkaliphilus metalliredigens (strain QYMF) TaxID=293826 RepID=A6TRL9_ALKMQ|nr:hypothetical protein [Alkaliphilus metalliredigens]ABR48837.1 hypothetical protein Amet_2685 [Alkaliphilus metalliredigens QYMF]
MNTLSNVIGYPLEEALILLDIPTDNVLIIESKGKNVNENGEPRVIQQQNLQDGKVKLVISYF